MKPAPHHVQLVVAWSSCIALSSCSVRSRNVKESRNRRIEEVYGSENWLPSTTGPNIRNGSMNAVYWVRWSEVQEQGLESWQTKSFAIMTKATTLGDCINRETLKMENE